MYHITSNSPPTESVYTPSSSARSTSFPSAALNTETSTPLPASSRPEPPARSRTPQPTRQPLSPASPPQDPEPNTVFLARWGPYQTLTQMRASPHYLCIDFPTPSPSPSSDENNVPQESLNPQNEHVGSMYPERRLTMHAVLPIPRHHLQRLTEEQRGFLYGYLACSNKVSVTSPAFLPRSGTTHLPHRRPRLTNLPKTVRSNPVDVKTHHSDSTTTRPPPRTKPISRSKPKPPQTTNTPNPTDFAL
ncbi:hypothetical protein BDW02DRAFT_579981 [Decorospora gaudefroyi]|uniref:Uncharacterized protein n=1 Tax=Decorospora gaudefroyi TaxID=184978 RepID=A0A6A5KHQ8_9PLEO|nr:hypothetical protein BDW02DRAFT_579981 [Decorospora gaudefroyi]